MNLKKKLINIVVLGLIIVSLLGSLSMAAEYDELEGDILKLETIKNDMMDAGINVLRMNDLITEARLYLESRSYDDVRRIISEAYSLKDQAYETKQLKESINGLYLDVKSRNLSLMDVTNSKVEWDLVYANREFENENYEESQNILTTIEKILLKTINSNYGHLSDSLIIAEEKATSLEIETSRIRTLQTLASDALKVGKIGQLEIIREEINNLNEVFLHYEKIKDDLINLKTKDFSIQRINDGLSAVEMDISFGEYDSALEKLKILQSLVDEAFRIDAEIKEIEALLSEQEEPFEEETALVEKSKQELILGNYEQAASKLDEAKKSLENSRAGLLISKASKKESGLKDFIAKNWKTVVVALIIILVIVLLTLRIWGYKLRKIRIKRLKKEIQISEEMMKTLQREYFVQHKMSRDNYDESYEHLQEGIMTLNDKISSLNTKIKKDRKNNI
ncbi:MAG: hypothetical protein ABH828_03390 [archaeon]